VKGSAVLLSIALALLFLAYAEGRPLASTDQQDGTTKDGMALSAAVYGQGALTKFHRQKPQQQRIEMPCCPEGLPACVKHYRRS
jgi:hypothetical protein